MQTGLKAAQEKTRLNDAVRTAVGKSIGQRLSDCLYGFCFYWWFYG